MHYNPFNPDDQSKEESVFKGRPAPYFAMEEMWMKLMEEMWKKYTDEGVD